MTDTQELINQLRERADALGMDSLKSGTRPEVAIFGDIANELTLAADALEAATSAPAVDREALVERVDGSALDHFLKSLNGDEAGDVDYVWAEDGNTGWVMRGGNDVASVLLAAVNALEASGLLRGVRDVENAPAVDREALARVVEEFIEGLRAERRLYPDVYRLELADAIIAHLGARDVRDVQAEQRERDAQIADSIGHQENNRYSHIAWEVAQAIREARSER